MDPWLEQRGVYPGFHNRYIAYLSEALNAVLPRPYFADIANRVVIEGEGEPGVREPDVGVFHPDRTTGTGGVAVADPAEVRAVVVHVPRDEITEWLVQVRSAEEGDRLVTSLEVLSPSNKGADRTTYRRKQRELIERKVNLVEVDVLRGGTHTTSVPLAQARQAAGMFDCHVCVYRPEQPEDFEVYPIRLPQRLPVVRIPLRPDVPPVSVDLQTVFDRAYDVGNYDRRLRYTLPPDPPLTPEQQAWADAILKAKGILPPA
jgi:Protein of unknown function (DUF4058)